MTRTLVAGGTGEVGTGVVRALLRAGGDVVVPSRSRERLDALRGRVADALGGGATLDTVEGGFGDQAAARAVAEQVGPLDHAVVSIGGWWSGPPARRVEPAVVDGVLSSGLHPHLHAAQALLPGLDAAPGATYLMVNGGGALEPVAGSSAVVVSAAAQLMLTRVLAAEQPDDGAAVRAVVLMTPIISHERTQGRDTWLTADEVGERVAALQREPGDEVVVRVESPRA